MRYRFIQEEKAVYPLTILCRCFQITRSGFYAWKGRPLSSRERANQELTARIKQIYQESYKTDGSLRVMAELRAMGSQVGHNRVARLYKEAGLCALRKRRRMHTTDSKHSFPIAPNLVNQQFQVAQKNQVWVTDITYLKTEQGWLYLAVILDLFSRKVVG